MNLHLRRLQCFSVVVLSKVKDKDEDEVKVKVKVEYKAGETVINVKPVLRRRQVPDRRLY